MIVLTDARPEPQRWTFDDKTTFQRDTPYHGWMTFITPSGKTYIFNMQYIVGVVPS